MAFYPAPFGHIEVHVDRQIGSERAEPSLADFETLDTAGSYWAPRTRPPRIAEASVLRRPARRRRRR
jgi:hypothetical protein